MDEPEKECKWCGSDMLWAAFGVLAGLAFLYMGLDVAVKGRITNMLSRSETHDSTD